MIAILKKIIILFILFFRADAKRRSKKRRMKSRCFLALRAVETAEETDTRCARAAYPPLFKRGKYGR
jgi:hypothetical protein